MLLHRRSPLEPAIRPLRDSGALAFASGTPADHAGVLALVADAEGVDRAIGEEGV